MGKPEYKKFRANMNICLTSNQYKELAKRADTKETSVSEYVRDILFPNQD